MPKRIGSFADWVMVRRLFETRLRKLFLSGGAVNPPAVNRTSHSTHDDLCTQLCELSASRPRPKNQ